MKLIITITPTRKPLHHKTFSAFSLLFSPESSDSCCGLSGRYIQHSCCYSGSSNHISLLKSNVSNCSEPIPNLCKESSIVNVAKLADHCVFSEGTLLERKKK